ncbi:VWA domain-containing protein [bacterium]|nr:VWA domain-containing protein [bacterium]
MMKLKVSSAILLAISLFVFLPGLAVSIEKIDEIEPNNKLKEAQAITIPCVISGSFSERAEKDIYAFTVPREGLPSLYVVLTNRNDLNPTLDMLDENGKVLTKSDFFKDGQGEYLTSLKLEPGEYFLQVGRHGAKETDGLPYTLSIDQVPEVSPEDVRKALHKALDYLVSQQGDDGGFPEVKLGIVSAPAMVIQALLGAECLERDDWETVYKAIDFVKTYYKDPADYKQDRHGLKNAGGIFAQKSLYEHGIALTALIEAYALGAGDDLANIIHDGLDYLLRAQLTKDRPAIINGPIPRDSKYYGGWRYAADSKDADISVTGWQIIALTAAKSAGFQVPADRFDAALQFTRRCYREDKGEFAYTPDGDIGTGRCAMGALCMQLLGAGDDPEVQNALRVILTRAPAWEGEPLGGAFPFYYWYYGTRAAYLAGGETWDLWHQATCGMLVRHQNGNGSWELNQKELRKLDKIYATSLGALILELCCGSPPIYLRTDKAPARKVPPPRNEISVSIETPVANAMIQGPVEIRAIPVVPERVTVKRVVFYLDGEELGELTEGPWVWQADLGPGVKIHQFKVVAENDLGKQAAAEVATRQGQNRIKVRIVQPRGGIVLGEKELFVKASGHPDSPLRGLTVQVDGQQIYSGSEPEYRAQYDFGTVGGQEIVATAVNALGSEAVDRVKLKEQKPLEVDFVATVTDQDNNYILDLEKESFSVLEDGVSQEVLRFSRELTPVSMAMVLDVSGSMKRHMRGVQGAAVQFVSQIRPVDRVMVIEFSDRAKVIQPFTSDANRLKQVIQKTKAQGGTALYDAVVMACDHLKREKGRTAIILLTDGKDEDKKGKKPGSVHTLEQAGQAAKETGVTIYSLGLGKGVAKEVLQDLAKKSGGRAYFPPTVEDLAEVYELVAKELRSQYSIGYSSTNRIRDRAWRMIEVKVPGTEYTVRAKEGYFAK